MSGRIKDRVYFNDSLNVSPYKTWSLALSVIGGSTVVDEYIYTE